MHITAVVAQFPVTFSIQTNLEIIDTILAQTTPGDLVVLPEGSVSGYADDLSFLDHIDPRQLATSLDHLRAEAQQRGVTIWAGACTPQDGLWFNAAYGFSPDGATQVYHKINLATHERGVFTAGSRLPVFLLRTPAGTVPVGVQMCRELRYPEQWGWLARCGAQVILHLNNAVGNDTFQPVWKSHLVSRAAETQRFILSANNAAPRQVSPTIAVAPNGQVLGEIVSPDLGILRVDLDLTKVSNWYLEQCRTDVVIIEASH